MLANKVGEIFYTEDLNSFKKLDGNRGVADGRVEKIMDSIRNVGYIGSPIIVNEKYEVVDGQGRLEACRRLGIGIPYTVIPGVGIRECISMNIKQTNWKSSDYVKSYAERGFPDYIMFSEFINGHVSKRYNYTVLAWALGNRNLNILTDSIKNGTLTCTEQDIQKAETYLRTFDLIESDVMTNRKEALFISVGWCMDMQDVDNNKLIRSINCHPKAFRVIANTQDAIRTIEQVYNIRAKNHVYIETNWLKMLGNHGGGPMAANQKGKE